MPLAVWEVNSFAIQSHLANGVSTGAAFAMRFVAPVPSPVPATVRTTAHQHHVPHRDRGFLLPSTEDELLFRRRHDANPWELGSGS